MSTVLATHAQHASPAPRGSEERGVALNAVRETMDALKAIRTFIKEEFRADLDYGVIPGTGTKPALLQPGAQKAAMYFNARPDHHVEKTELGNGHVEYLITTELTSRATGTVIGMGLGSCTTMESKYRYRKAARQCPACGAEAIIKGKAEFGGGWLCFKKQGGCGAKYAEDDQAITSQAAGRADNPDVYDARNTVLKMAVKRSFVAAALSLGCLSELFTQDLEETYDMGSQAPPEPVAAPPPFRPVKAPPKGKGRSGGKQEPPARLSGWEQWAAQRVQAENLAFRKHLESEGLPEASRTNLTTIARLELALCDVMVVEGLLNEGEILNTEGERDRARMHSRAALRFEAAPEWVQSEVATLLADCWGRGCAAFRVSNPKALLDDLHAQDVAEVESQESLEDTAYEGREPGEEG